MRADFQYSSPLPFIVSWAGLSGLCPALVWKSEASLLGQTITCVVQNQPCEPDRQLSKGQATRESKWQNRLNTERPIVLRFLSNKHSISIHCYNTRASEVVVAKSTLPSSCRYAAKRKLSSYKVVEASILCSYTAAMEVAHELLHPLHIKTHKKIEHMAWLVVKASRMLDKVGLLPSLVVNKQKKVPGYQTICLPLLKNPSKHTAV